MVDVPLGYEFATHIPFLLYLYNMKIVISEQQLRRIITEQSSTVVVSGTYTANDCDELHAFQGSGGKVIGNMNNDVYLFSKLTWLIIAIIICNMM
jgi:hypothetical protein